MQLPSISILWKQLTCQHEWKFHSYFDETKERGGKFIIRERAKIICKKCNKIKVREKEDYEGKVKRVPTKSGSSK
jgi:hypothetical protein